MKYVRQKRFYISRIVSSNISNSSTRNFKYDQECKKSAFEDNVKLIIKGIEYAILNADLEGTARPKTGAANAGDFGANASDYASFSIDSLDPITISLTGAGGSSKFGSCTVTKATSSNLKHSGSGDGVISGCN